MVFLKQCCVLSLAGSILLSACFHKSTTTGSADDIKHSFTCHTANGDFLVTHEEIFQATSKSSGPKGTYISGYADYRYTIRNMQTGEQVKRLVTGDGDNDFLPIGFDGKNLWCYSPDKKTGLHARSPESLDITITLEQVEKENPFLAGKLNAPKINEAEQFYLYELVNNHIILTDIEGNLFSLDPQTLKAIPVKEKPDMPNSFSDAHSTSIHLGNGNTIYLSGDPRKQVDLGHDNKSEETYLSGEFLLEQGTSRLASVASQELKATREAMEKIQQEHDSLFTLYPVLKDEREAYLKIKDYRLIEHFFNLDSKLKEWAERDSKNKAREIINNLSGMALGADSNTVYILHANNLTDTSSILISKLSIRDNKCQPQWTTLIPQVYFNPDKGIKINRMAEVFKSGDPQFRYEWYGLEGNILVGIKMLFAFAIDTNTGKLLWKQQL